MEKLLGLQSPPKKTAASVTKVTDDAAAQDSDGVSESDVEMNIVGLKNSPLVLSSQSDIPSLEIK